MPNLSRRQVMLGAGALPLLARPNDPSLQITGLDVFVVKVNQRGNWIFVRLKTARGLTGLGEASQGAGFSRASGEADRAMEKALGEYFALARELTPFDIETFRQRGRAKAKAAGRLGATAFSALEQAMWDLAGKALGAPVHALLGGKLRGELAVYANINRATNEDRSPAGFAANAQQVISEGFRAIKAAPFDDFPPLTAPPAELEKFAALGIARIEAMRKAIGPGRDLLIDVHSHFDRKLAIEVARRLEPQNLYWYEEPVPPENLEDTAAIRKAIRQRMAGGEVLFGMEGFAPLTRSRALEVIMPDVKHCGGIQEMRKIAAVAELDGVQISPHNPSGPVSTAASTPLCAGLPNFSILEYAWGEVPWRKDLLVPPEQFAKGQMRVSDAPGFGVELNEKVVQAHG
jgi:galactonate dehydratase